MTTDDSLTQSTPSCPSCGAAADDASNFCEACGAPLSAAAAAATPGVPAAPDPTQEASPFDDLGSGPISRSTTSWSAPAEPRPACLACGGEIGEDGYCEQCGVKAQSPRDHFREQPADWVAGVCDRGLRHHRNEDAMALIATPAGQAADRRAVLVVLDGVSNTDDSQAGSLAGAHAARDALRTPLPQGLGTPQGTLAAVSRTMASAVEAATAQIERAAPPDAPNPASATFCACVLEGSTLTYANVGDSRIYWLPDGSPGVQLSVDDSAAQEQMALGMTREEAETSPQAHAITRWLGRDSDDPTPRVGQLVLDEPGWVLVCSDGLWNYASEPAALQERIRAAATTDPAALALALTDFANASGGRDNITTALARIETDPATTTKEQPDG